MVLRLRSSESVLERDVGKEEKSRIFTLHQAKHALLFKLPEMIAANFFGKSKHLYLSFISTISCIAQYLVDANILRYHVRMIVQ